MIDFAQDIRSLIDGEPWAGTVTQLAASLAQLSETAVPSAAHLAIWLRRHEPTLWWDHGVRICFSRTGEQRRVHISRRSQLLARSLSSDDSTSEISTVT
jgi:hypothetical protein